MTATGTINTILLIDDDELVNFLNETIIANTRLATTIKTAVSAEIAIDILAQATGTDNWPDIILVDINMPGIDGWGFIELYIEHFGTTSPKPLIGMLSSSLDPRDERRVTQSEIVDMFLPKPITKDLVVKIRDTYLEKYPPM